MKLFATPRTRSLPFALPPIALHAALTDGGTAKNTLFLESGVAEGGERTRGSQKSLLLVGAAVRVTCTLPEVRVESCSPAGTAILAALADALAAFVARPSATEFSPLVLTFPRCDDPDAEARLHAPSPLDVLRALTRATVTEDAGPFSVFLGGLQSFDFVGAFEDLPQYRENATAVPDYVYYLAESLIIVDPRAGQTQILCTAFHDGERPNDPVINDAAQRLADLVRRCEGLHASQAAGAGAPTAAPTQVRRAREEVRRAREQVHPDLGLDLDDGAYEAIVATMKTHIVAGDVFQIVPSRSFRVPCTDPLAAYRVLRERNPSPYQFFLCDRDFTLFGASPETSIRVTPEPARGGARGDLRIHVRPIAGTRRRGATADEDDRVEADLRLDHKEVAEHMMLVDLARNDLARVCRTGTRRVQPLLVVERYSHVMHLVSGVTGILRDGLDAFHAIAAAMNMGTLVGAPKVRALELLRRHEATRRGAYGGAIGYATGRGAFDSAVIIRSAVVENGVATVRAGAGVVHDSVPRLEADETRRKAAATLEAIAISEAFLAEGRTP